MRWGNPYCRVSCSASGLFSSNWTSSCQPLPLACQHPLLLCPTARSHPTSYVLTQPTCCPFPSNPSLRQHMKTISHPTATKHQILSSMNPKYHPAVHHCHWLQLIFLPSLLPLKSKHKLCNTFTSQHLLATPKLPQNGGKKKSHTVPGLSPTSALDTFENAEL